MSSNIFYDSNNQSCKRVFGELVPYDPDNCNYTQEGIDKLLQMKCEREDIIESLPYVDNTNGRDIAAIKNELTTLEDELSYADFYNEYLKHMEKANQ